MSGLYNQVLAPHSPMTIGAESPTTPEIQAQLERMLESKRFRNAKNQSDFLRLAVERALAGKKTPGHIVAKALFKDKFLKDESLDVRVTAGNLRATLKKYYGSEGRADLVRIALPDPPEDKTVKLPEGEAYTPMFSYNSAHPVGKEFKLGMYHLARGMWEDYDKAHHHFVAVLRMAPEHIGAAIGLAETFISTLFWAREFNSRADIDELAEQAAGFLDRVGERASRFWRLHAAAGFMITEHGLYLDRAKLAFDTALKLDRASTEAYPPYFYFLIKVGQTSEAVRLARQYLESHPDNMAAHIACAKVLIQTDQFLEAKAVLKKALAIDRGYYAVHFFLALITLAQKRTGEILGHLMQVKLLADNTSYISLLRWCWKLVENWPQEKKKEWYKVADQIKSISPWPESS
jgi:tetratricopeptide (TPR) repeat protein